MSIHTILFDGVDVFFTGGKSERCVAKEPATTTLVHLLLVGAMSTSLLVLFTSPGSATGEKRRKTSKEMDFFKKTKKRISRAPQCWEGGVL